LQAVTLPPCLAGDDPFTATGFLGPAGRPQGDATAITAVDLADAVYDDGTVACERVTVELATPSGAPAIALGSVEARVLSPAGVVRLLMPEEVTETAVAYATFESALVDRIYVVVDDDERQFVDVHLAAAAEGRVSATASPARLLLDVRPGETAPTGAGAVANGAVILDPAGAESSYPLEVTGYVRSPAPEVPLTLTAGTETIATTTVRGLDYPWRFFTARFDDGPGGPVTIAVGEAETSLVMP
jgi:hypothetical protein